MALDELEDARHAERLEERHELEVPDLDGAEEWGRERIGRHSARPIGGEEGRERAPAARADEGIEVRGRHGGCLVGSRTALRILLSSGRIRWVKAQGR